MVEDPAFSAITEPVAAVKFPRVVEPSVDEPEIERLEAVTVPVVVKEPADVIVALPPTVTFPDA